MERIVESNFACNEVAVVHQRADRALARFRRQIPRSVRDELCQEATLRAWGTREVRDRPAFAHRVAQRLAIDWMRRDRTTVLAGEPLDSADPSWARADTRVDASSVLQLLSAAPPNYRALVEGHFVQDLDLEDLARAELRARGEAGEGAFGRARDALYKRRRRVLAWLRQRLADGVRPVA